MNRVVFILIALCSLMTACNPSDTKPAKVWRRQVEPWLSGNPVWQRCEPEPLKRGQLLAEVQCGPEEVRQKEACDDFITTHQEARRQLVEAPHCVEEVLAALTRFATTTPEALNDVAAAHYVRAQREDEPLHLLHALHAAAQAVDANRQSAAARFNLALVQEALGFQAEAIESWDTVLDLDSSSSWADDARRRRDGLKSLVQQNAVTRWEHTKNRLDRALRAGDTTTVRQLIDPFPAAAYEYLYRDLLPKRLHDARVLAGPLSERLGGDRDPLERTGNPATAVPARLMAAAGRATATSRDGLDHVQALTLLDGIATQAHAGRYRYLNARIQSLRGYVLQQQGRYVEALAAYDAARSVYTELDDRENLAINYTRTAGIYTATGAAQRAWRDAVRAGRYAPHVRHVQQRHAYRGESAMAVAAFGYREVALAYLTSATEELERLFAQATVDERPELRVNVVIALRARAQLELRLGRADAANAHFEQAAELVRTHDDQTDKKSLLARLAEVRGQLLLQNDPHGAIAAFTESLELATGEAPTYHVELYAQRAKARLSTDDTAGALADLEHAIAQLRKEENSILERRHREAAAEIWTPYFSRFRETYDLLMQRMVEENRPDDAFYYNERARAAEPLNLIQQFHIVPIDLRRRLENNLIDLAFIQSSLPPDTFVLQYAVLEDHTYTWILSHHGSVAIAQPVTRQNVIAWARALQNAARKKDEDGFDRGLYAPYAALFEYPLSIVSELNGARGQPRIVVVPDGAMHGLPIGALRSAKTNRHVLQDAIVEIAGSTALYLISLERDRALPTDQSSLLLVGNPKLSEALKSAYDLDDLRFAELEVQEIASSHVAATSLVGADATPARFLSLAPGSSIIHVAGHAIANEQEPHRSFLALAQDGEDTGELDAQELLTQMKLDRTRLVILAACSSAAGSAVGLEGVAPLVRPFIGSGVPAVIGSLWTVNDATTRALLVSFHRHYRGGKDAAAALQAAQLELLLDREDPGLRPALAWGSFQVIGHASSPFPSPASLEKEKPP